MATPENLNGRITSGHIDPSTVRTLVIDEVDHIAKSSAYQVASLLDRLP